LHVPPSQLSVRLPGIRHWWTLEAVGHSDLPSHRMLCLGFETADGYRDVGGKASQGLALETVSMKTSRVNCWLPETGQGLGG
jgi:hypothetical protein